MSTVSKALEELGMAFADAEVRSVAIVDDGYDAPAVHDLDAEHWLAFAVAVDEAEELGPFAEVLEEIGDLGAFGDLQEPVLHRLWRTYGELSGSALVDVRRPLQALSSNFLERSMGGRGQNCVNWVP